MPPKDKCWTPEQDDFLRRCAEQGQSTSAAAALLDAIFGVARSRMAVIGRAHRKGIVFRGQQEYTARQKSATAGRRQARKAGKPKPAPETNTGIVAANLLRRRAQLKVEAARGQPSDAAAEFAAAESAVAEAMTDNPGVLFLERGVLQCAMPLPGWDQAGPWEKRVCGRPVLLRRLVVAGIAVAQPTSWCKACSGLVYGAARKKLDIKGLSRLDKTVARAA